MKHSKPPICLANHINHVAIVVKNLEETLEFYRESFGVPETKIVSLEDQGVRATLVPVGGSNLELIQPIQPDSGVGRFLEARGEAFHHICFEVNNLKEKLDDLDKEGFKLIDNTPRQGLAGMIAFIHPKSTRGILIELVESQ